jgi:bleomycin hydrolase
MIRADEFGYYFFSEDYVKLKMLDFMVHREAVRELLQKF